MPPRLPHRTRSRSPGSSTRAAASRSGRSSGAAPSRTRSPGGSGAWVFGCDDCQTVCPWNRRPEAGRRSRARAAPGPGARSRIDELLALAEEEYRRRFYGTSLARARYDGLVRNALLAAGRDRAILATLDAVRAHLESPHDGVRAAARWALERLEQRDALRRDPSRRWAAPSRAPVTSACGDAVPSSRKGRHGPRKDSRSCFSAALLPRGRPRRGRGRAGVALSPAEQRPGCFTQTRCACRARSLGHLPRTRPRSSSRCRADGSDAGRRVRRARRTRSSTSSSAARSRAARGRPAADLARRPDRASASGADPLRGESTRPRRWSRASATLEPVVLAAR